MKELARFFIVSVVGVSVDIAIAFSLATLLAAPLLIASVVGFLIAALGNYALHEMWTFRREVSQLSRIRALHYSIAAGVTLCSRLVAVAVLSAWISRDHAIVVLVGGAAVSFFVSYFISKLVVFSSYADNKGDF